MVFCTQPEAVTQGGSASAETCLAQTNQQQQKNNKKIGIKGLDLGLQLAEMLCRCSRGLFVLSVDGHKCDCGTGQPLPPSFHEPCHHPRAGDTWWHCPLLQEHLSSRVHSPSLGPIPFWALRGPELQVPDAVLAFRAPLCFGKVVAGAG